MPEFIASYNGLRSPLARVNELAQAIRENGDDIICLQEGLWSVLDVGELSLLFL